MMYTRNENKDRRNEMKKTGEDEKKSQMNVQKLRGGKTDSGNLLGSLTPREQTSQALCHTTSR